MPLLPPLLFVIGRPEREVVCIIPQEREGSESSLGRTLALHANVCPCVPSHHPNRIVTKVVLGVGNKTREKRQKCCAKSKPYTLTLTLALVLCEELINPDVIVHACIVYFYGSVPLTDVGGILSYLPLHLTFSYPDHLTLNDECRTGWLGATNNCHYNTTSIDCNYVLRLP